LEIEIQIDIDIDHRNRNRYRKRKRKRNWKSKSKSKQYLQQTLQMLILGKESLVSRIQNSKDLQAVYVAYCAQIENCPIVSQRIKNLSSAKHRMESVRTPAGRAIVFLDALISTAEWIKAHRPKVSREGIAATTFLQNLDEETYIALAMYADAANLVMGVTRFSDHEWHESAQLNLQLTICANQADFLFLQGHVVSHGFTKYRWSRKSKSRRIGIPSTSIADCEE
jgi:hypothetical protein